MTRSCGWGMLAAILAVGSLPVADVFGDHHDSSSSSSSSHHGSEGGHGGYSGGYSHGGHFEHDPHSYGWSGGGFQHGHIVGWNPLTGPTIVDPFAGGAGPIWPGAAILNPIGPLGGNFPLGGGFGQVGNMPLGNFPLANGIGNGLGNGNGLVPNPLGFGGGLQLPPARPFVSNEASRAKAATFVGFGDDHFQKQKWNAAYERYKDAAKVAPDLGEPHFRQAFALAAMGKSELAVRAIRRGLALQSNWPDSDFTLNSVYRNNALAKTTHWEALATAATEHPTDGDPLYLLGVELYFSGEHARAKPFFQRALTLAPEGDVSHITAFLERLKPPPAAAAPANALPGNKDRQI